MSAYPNRPQPGGWQEPGGWREQDGWDDQPGGWRGEQDGWTAQRGWPEQPPMYSGRPPRPGRGRPRRRRGRGWIALGVVLVVLAVIFVVGDRVARSYAQNMIASKIASDGFPAKPTVTIPGFPFLTQLAARDIRTIDLSASNVREDSLTISSINATATGVHLDSGYNSATISQISGTGLITFASLASSTGAQGLTISADPSAGPDMAKASLGPLSVTAKVVQAGPSRISIQLENLPAIASSVAGVQSDYTIDVPQLPAGLKMTGVSVTSQGISIHVAARDTTLSQ